LPKKNFFDLTDLQTPKILPGGGGDWGVVGWGLRGWGLGVGGWGVGGWWLGLGLGYVNLEDAQ